MSRTYRRKGMSGYRSWCSDATYFERKTKLTHKYARRSCRGPFPYRPMEFDECRREMMRFHTDNYHGFNGGVPWYTRNQDWRLHRHEARKQIRLGIRYDDWDNRIIDAVDHDYVEWYW